MRDLHNRISVAKALEAIVVNNDTEGTGAVVDLVDCEAAQLIVNVGASGDTLSGTVYHSLTLQHGDLANGSDMAAVAQADVVGGTVTSGVFAVIDDPAEDSAVFSIGYVGSKRYIRLFVDTTGTHTNGTPMAAEVVKHRLRHVGTTA